MILQRHVEGTKITHPCPQKKKKRERILFHSTISLHEIESCNVQNICRFISPWILFMGQFSLDEAQSFPSRYAIWGWRTTQHRNAWQSSELIHVTWNRQCVQKKLAKQPRKLGDSPARPVHSAISLSAQEQNEWLLVILIHFTEYLPPNIQYLMKCAIYYWKCMLHTAFRI